MSQNESRFPSHPQGSTRHCSEAYQAPSLSFTVHTHPITVPVLGNLPRLDDGILWWVMSGFLSALVGESPYSLDIQTVKVYASEVHISAQEMFGCQGFLIFFVPGPDCASKKSKMERNTYI